MDHNIGPKQFSKTLKKINIVSEMFYLIPSSFIFYKLTNLHRRRLQFLNCIIYNCESKLQ
jgi:hypothetical protein